MHHLLGFLGAAVVWVGWGWALAPEVATADEFAWSADSTRQEGVPRGTVTKHRWTSKIFSGTVRDYWVYVPKQYDPTTPAALMVFQDGARYVNEDGQFRTPIVFDNLIHQGAMPVTIGVFVDPGVVPPTKPEQEPRYNRSFEYDSLGDQYVRFLLKEILPAVSRTFNLSEAPNLRAICGADSGGICAFTCAWERPDAFGKVLCHGGSFINLRGGNNYPSLIRLVQRKPIRIYVQDAGSMLDDQHGSWSTANQELASALEYAGYDFTVDFAASDSTDNEAGIRFPLALRWLWRDVAEASPADDSPAHQAKRPAALTTTGKPAAPIHNDALKPLDLILIEGEDWELVGDGMKFTEGPAVDSQGRLYFSDVPASKIYRLDASGRPQLFLEKTGGANGLMFGPGGLLFACQSGRERIVSYNQAGKEKVLARNVYPNDLVVTRTGDIYFTDPNNRLVMHLKPNGEPRAVDRGIGRPNGIIMLPGQGTLVVADSAGPYLWMFRIETDGSLAHKEHFCTMAMPPGKGSGACGLTVDAEGRLYAATYLGVQVFDQEGRLIGIIEKPDNAFLSNLVFGGPKLDILYATSSDKVYARKTKISGVRYFDPPPKTTKDNGPLANRP